MSAIISDSEIEAKLLAMREDNFSQNILIPLFKKIYNGRVEFVGGIVEKGRDILIQYSDQLGNLKRIGVQVKKIQPKVNSSQNSFQQLLNQVSQMKMEGVVDRQTSNKVKINECIFVTPYLIGERLLDSHNGAFKIISEEHSTSIVDGYKLIELLKHHHPDLIEQLLDSKELIQNKIFPKLSNQTLMKALNFDKVKNLCDIYCDINFEIGSKAHLYFLNKRLITDEKTLKVRVASNKIEAANSENEALYNICEIYLFNVEQLKEALDVTNKRAFLLKEAEGLRESAETPLNKIKKIISTSKFSNEYPKFLNHGEFVQFFSVLKEAETTSDSIELITECGQILSLWKERETIQASYREVNSKIDDSKVELEINSGQIAEYLEKLKNDLLKTREKIEHDLLGYMRLMNKFSRFVRIISQYQNHFRFEAYKPSNASRSLLLQKLSFNIDKAFNTGLNISVLGVAGSGKTTNLQMHAHNLYKNQSKNLVIYASLNEIAQLTNEQKSTDLLLGIHQYLNNLNLPVRLVDLKEHLAREKAIVILDSVDEAITSYRWVISSLIDLKNNLSKCQIITSSRYSVSAIHDLEFVNISLLPFNDEQKFSFFNKWFSKDLIKVNKIITHLKSNSKLNDIVTNPLSATILAVLSENNIPLPKTEASLYKKRFELLSGMFDRFKGVNRSCNSPEDLIEIARFLAFEIHVSELRLFTKEFAIEMCMSPLLNFGEAHVISLIDELISPAEILVPTTEEKLSFGHLRYQEYLASEEINSRRNFNYSNEIKLTWWQDVFKLYSQHARDVRWIVHDACSNGYASDIEELLVTICSSQNEILKKELLNRISLAVEDEMINETGFGIDQEFDEYDLNLRDDRAY